MREAEVCGFRRTQTAGFAISLVGLAFHALGIMCRQVTGQMTGPDEQLGRRSVKPVKRGCVKKPKSRSQEVRCGVFQVQRPRRRGRLVGRQEGSRWGLWGQQADFGRRVFGDGPGDACAQLAARLQIKLADQRAYSCLAWQMVYVQEPGGA